MISNWSLFEMKIAPLQKKFIAESRAEAVLDKRIPLGTMHCIKPIEGPSAAAYYERKFRLGVPATYWFHQTAKVIWQLSRRVERQESLDDLAA
jgi:hypothetical protein